MELAGPVGSLGAWVSVDPADLQVIKGNRLEPARSTDYTFRFLFPFTSAPRLKGPINAWSEGDTGKPVSEWVKRLTYRDATHLKRYLVEFWTRRMKTGIRGSRTMWQVCSCKGTGHVI